MSDKQKDDQDEIIVTEETLAKLREVSVETLTTRLSMRGLRNVCVAGVMPLNPALPRMVGEAYTLRYIPAREDLDARSPNSSARKWVKGFHNRPTNPQRQAIETIPAGQVFVIDCRGVPGVAALGSILGTRLAKRGLAGVVADGGVRDASHFAEMDFPVFCTGSAPPPNFNAHHAADAQVPIGCGGVAVYPGDIIVGDVNGVAVVPRYLAEELAEECLTQERQEEFIMQEVLNGASTFDVYPMSQETIARYEAWARERHGQG